MATPHSVDRRWRITLNLCPIMLCQHHSPIMFNIMLVSLTVSCIYTCAVCVCLIMIESTQLTEPRCDHSQCSILEILNPPTKYVGFSTKK